jgi:bifunctional UDP-N-acetylglucosamine pyrophosphorylase/glucosamine-1-phosphate N-acetyltransferase
MPTLHAVVLAAGKGTRMKSVRPKVLHLLAGRTVLDHVLGAVEPLGAESTTLVIGHGGEEVRAALSSRPSLQFVSQSPQLGTGHALMQAEPQLRGKSGTVLLLHANVPLISTGTLNRLIERHRSTRAAMTLLTSALEDPYGYEHVVRDAQGQVIRIVEEREASGDERAIREVSTGIYCFDLAPLLELLQALAADASQGEYYLTDLVPLCRRLSLKVETLQLESAGEMRGVATRVDVADLTAIFRARKNRELMLNGVTIEDPSATYIDMDVTVGADTVIGPGVLLEGRTSVGERCRIHAGSRLTNATLGNGIIVLDRSIIIDSRVGSNARIGPFAHIRPDSDVAEDAHVGNFVELKKTRLGRRSKANHLAYLGDAAIGDDVNVGAGTITCNYDGVNKHKTVIEDGVFIGSDSQLIAPVTIGKGAYVGAGSSITDDVAPDALAVARGRQATKPGWAAARRAQLKMEKAEKK